MKTIILRSYKSLLIINANCTGLKQKRNLKEEKLSCTTFSFNGGTNISNFLYIYLFISFTSATQKVYFFLHVSFWWELSAKFIASKN